MIVTAALLGLCLAAYALFLRGRVADRIAARGWVDPWSRDAHFAIWCAKALVLFGGAGLIALAGVGRIDALAVVPPEFVRARATAMDLVGGDFPVGLMLGAMIVGGAVAEAIAWLRRRATPFMLGDIGVMMPRNARERRWGAAMAVIAGTTEEIFFRLAVPLLLARLTGSAGIGFAIGLVMFALAHRYQGWIGVAATSVVGALMIGLYLSSGDLWLAMLVHGFIDLNGLVLRSLLRSILPRRV